MSLIQESTLPSTESETNMSGIYNNVLDFVIYSLHSIIYAL